MSEPLAPVRSEEATAAGAVARCEPELRQVSAWLAERSGLERSRAALRDQAAELGRRIEEITREIAALDAKMDAPVARIAHALSPSRSER